MVEKNKQTNKKKTNKVVFAFHASDNIKKKNCLCHIVNEFRLNGWM